MGMGGIEKYIGAGHSFDLQKYKKVFNKLIAAKILNQSQFVKPPRPSREELLMVHTKEYLESLNSRTTVAR